MKAVSALIIPLFAISFTANASGVYFSTTKKLNTNQLNWCASGKHAVNRNKNPLARITCSEGVVYSLKPQPPRKDHGWMSTVIYFDYDSGVTLRITHNSESECRTYGAIELDKSAKFFSCQTINKGDFYFGLSHLIQYP